MNILFGTTGDLILVTLGILIGFGFCCFWVVNLKAKFTSKIDFLNKIYDDLQENYIQAIKDSHQQYWRAVEAENKLSKRGENGRFVKKTTTGACNSVPKATSDKYVQTA